MENFKEISEAFKYFDFDIDLFSFALDMCTQGWYVANVTKNEFLTDIIVTPDSNKYAFTGLYDLQAPFTYTQFHSWWIDNMLLKGTSEYKKANSLEFLEDSFQNGHRSVQVNYKTKLLNGDIKTIVQTSMLARDKVSNDLISLTIVNVYREDQISVSEPSYNRTIIQTLSNDYEAVFYVNLKNDSITVVRIVQEFVKRNPKISNTVVYSSFIKQLLSSSVLRDDIQSTVLGLSKNNIYREFNQKDYFFINYRIKTPAGNILYYQFKLVKTKDWETQRSFILGIHNVDEETKKNLEHMEKIKRQSEANLQMSAVINTMSNDYADIFYIEIDKDRVFDFRVSEIFKKMKPATNEVYASFSTFCNSLQQMIMAYVHKDDQKKFLSLLDSSKLHELLSAESSYYDTTRIKINGKYIYYQVKIAKDLKAKDEFNLVIGLRNIDSQHRIEVENQNKLKEARNRAEEANKSKSTFLFNMSHDIRTPMNAIIGYSSMAQKHAYDPQSVIEYLEKIKLSSNHLLKLINDVLDMARIENGKLSIEEKSFHLISCIDNIVEMQKINAGKNQIDIQLKYENIKTEYVIGDNFRLNQVFLNIIGNSIKYTNHGGTITVTIKETESEKKNTASYCFEVEDTGIGMSQDFLSHIFEMFSRERNTTSSGVQGTGLGMAIVKNLVDLMNGTIDIHSEINRGTKVIMNFSFKIPEDKLPSITDVNDSKNKKINLSGKKVLLVEDNDLNREIARDILEEEGIKVDEANDGTIAVAKIQDAKPGQYDFVLMDVQMPFMDGYTATKKIRQLKKEISKIPIIAMTANAFEEDRKKAIESGMDSHLSKPIQPALMFQTISDLLINKSKQDN